MNGIEHFYKAYARKWSWCYLLGVRIVEEKQDRGTDNPFCTFGTA